MDISRQGEDEKGHEETLSEQSLPHEETLSEQSLPPDSPDSSDAFGEQKLHPRVGDEYQVEIPPMLTPSDKLQYFANPCNFEVAVDISRHLLIGLPVPITWIYDRAKASKDERGELHANETCLEMESKEHVKECSSDLDEKELNDKVDCMDLKSMTSGYSLAPGLSSEPWSEFELDCFLLGLYVFGKNLLLVKRFMSNKEVGEILTFYYGRFYGSVKYKRWSDCRKVKGRKSIIGQRLLSGARQQELLSRLLSRLCGESRNTVLEVSKAFSGGRISLEEYVSTVKNLVGIHALVEAIGIGKGKEDLTSMVVECSKNSRTEMPSGRACSSLTYAEIVMYLTGDFRLSKARSSDLFWEAVWPRLLAKGWHSEEPKDRGCFKGSKNCLVFLMPGVKKFRRRLSKGARYFDSVSDVLQRVASEPELLMLEDEKTDGHSGSKKGNGCISVPNSDEDDRSDHQHHRYLKPRFSTALAEHRKLTIIDTTFVDGAETSKVRELKNLALEMKKTTSFQKKQPREGEVSLVVNKAGNPENIDILVKTVQESFHSNPLKGQLSHSGGGKLGDSDQSRKPVEKNHMNCNVAHSMAINCETDHRPKSSQLDHISRLVKRRRLTACSKADTRSMASKALCQRQREPSCVLSLPASSGTDVAASSKDCKVSSNTSSLAAEKHVREQKFNGEKPIQHVITVGQTSEHEDPSQSQIQPVANLNVLEPPTEAKTCRELKVEMEYESSYDQCVNSFSVSLDDTNENVESSEAIGGGCRRYSTRSRPMSTKALEALESSFYSPKLSRKRSPG